MRKIHLASRPRTEMTHFGIGIGFVESRLNLAHESAKTETDRTLILPGLPVFSPQAVNYTSANNKIIISKPAGFNSDNK